MLGKKLGGIEQSFVNYCILFQSLGYRVINIVHKDALIKEQLDQLALPYEEIACINRFDIRSSLKIKQLIAKHQANIIVAHGGRAMSLSRLMNRNIYIIGVSHNYNFSYLRNVNYAVTITQDMKNQLIQSKHGHTEETIKVIPNFLPCETIVTSKAQNNLDQQDIATSHNNKNNTPIIIGVMARLVKKKGVDLFVEAISALKSKSQKHFKVIIAGDGVEKESILELIIHHKLEDCITLSGWIKDKDSFYSNIDIFCLPSLHEPFGIVLIEAMAHGKLIVSSNTEGPNEILTDNKDAIIFETGNIDDMCHKLHYALDNFYQTNIQEIKQQAIITVNENYTLPTIRIIAHNIIRKGLDY